MIPGFLLEVLYHFGKPISWWTNTFTCSIQSEKSIRSRCLISLLYHEIRITSKNQLNSRFLLFFLLHLLSCFIGTLARLHTLQFSAPFFLRPIYAFCSFVQEEFLIRAKRTVIASTPESAWMSARKYLISCQVVKILRTSFPKVTLRLNTTLPKLIENTPQHVGLLKKWQLYRTGVLSYSSFVHCQPLGEPKPSYAAIVLRNQPKETEYWLKLDDFCGWN